MIETSVIAMTARLDSIRAFAYTRAENDRPLDGFEAPEIEIARSLASAFETKADEAEAIVRGVMMGLRLSPAVALDAIADAASQTRMNDTFGPAEEAVVLRSVAEAIDNGAEEARLLNFASSNPTRARPLYEGMIASAKYTTNTYFNRVVYPSLERAIQALIETPGSDSLVGYEDIHATMAARLKSVPYWRTVANGAASRAFHWGALTGGIDAGFTRYVLRAVLDRKTTDYCRRVNGTSYDIRDGQTWADKVASVDSVDELKLIAPWAKSGEDIDTLRNRGHIVPPFHGNCRTTIDLIR